MKTYPAFYNNGQDYQEKEVILFTRGEDLFYQQEKQIEVRLNINECRFEDFGPDQTLILWQDHKITLKKSDFKNLKEGLPKLKNDYSLLIKTTGFISLILITALVFKDPLLNFVAKLIPESSLVKMAEDLTNKLKKKDCIDSKKKKKIFDKVFKALKVSSDEVHFYLVKQKQINAMALPGKTMIFFSGLTSQLKHEDEFIGIFAHELAHIRLEHLKRGAAKSILYGVLSNLVFQGSKNLKKVEEFFATSYTQEEEQAADEYAKNLLLENGFSLQGMRNFMKRLKEKDKYLQYLVFSHPSYDKRIQTFTEKEPLVRKTILTSQEFKLLQDICH